MHDTPPHALGPGALLLAEISSGSLGGHVAHVLGAIPPWLGGVAAGSASAAGEIDWGPGTGKWEIGSNGGGERPVATIFRAGVEETVWDASTWAAFARSCAGLG